MKKNTQTEDENLSLSKQRKLERKKKQEQDKRNALIWKIVGIILAVLVAAGIIALIAQQVYRVSNRVTAGDDYSALLTDDGFIKDVNASSNIALCDYKNITVPLSEVEYTDEEMNEAIQQTLDQHAVLNTETTAKVADGDRVNIDYVGTIDGEEFEGGNTNGAGSDIIVGSNSFIDDFEQQLIGYGAGEELTVDVTFPEDYTQNPDVAGKDASFAVTVNGIYDVPVLDDIFVKENLSEYADTADGYREYLRETNYKSNMDQWISAYLTDNTTVNTYPKEYLKSLKSTQKFDDQTSYEYMNQLYSSYYGSSVYGSFDDYTGMSETDYDLSLNDTCKETEKANMIYQAILETEGITVTEDDYRAYLTDTTGSADSFDTQVERYGKGYTMQAMVRIKALEIVEGYATVE